MARRKQAARKTLVTDVREMLEVCAATNIRLAERRIARFLASKMRGTDLTLPQIGLMAHVAAAEDDTIGALADRLALDQSTLSRNLRSLERDRLVEITIVQRDQRRRAVWLTERGAQRLEAALPAWRRAHEALAAIVDPRQFQKIAKATIRLTRAVDRLPQRLTRAASIDASSQNSRAPPPRKPSLSPK